MSENEEQNRNLRIKQQKHSLMKRLLICVVILAIITAVFLYVNRSARGTEIDTNTFQEQLWSGNIKRIELNQSKIQIYYNNGDAHWMYRRDSIEEYVLTEWDKMSGEGKEVPKLVSGTTTTVSIINILYPIAGIVITILIVIFVVKQLKGANNKNYEFVKSRARIYPSKTKFSDVAGADEEKQELEDVVDFLKNPKKYTEMGAKIPKGVILVGPPGTGKTLLARAVAGEANVPFFTISGSDFMELFVGVGASRVRDLFENAKKAKPCIIFIDEIDAVGRQRGAGLGGGNDEREQTLNQLLVQMDGFETNEGIIVMAATNRVDILDPALLRPGRFDRRINISLPDVKGREEILKVHARGKCFSSDVNFKTIARITSGFTGAELENLLNESAILVAKENRNKITNIDIQKSIMKVSLGPQKRSRVTDKKDQFDTAVHEAGHAIVSRLAEEKTPVHEVSIIPRGGAGGYTVSTDEEDYTVYFRKKLLCKIEMLLGGITAEKLYVGDISTGASNDLKRASSIARRMVTEWGMSADVGMVYCGNDDEVFIGKSYQERVPYSESQGQIIDSEIKKIIDYCQAETEKILTENKDKLMTMVDVLLARETIYTEEVQMILDGKSKDEVVAYIDGKDKDGKSGILFDQYKKESEKNPTADVDLTSSIIDSLIKIAESREKEMSKIVSETETKSDDGEKVEETKTEDAKPVENQEVEKPEETDEEVETENVETKDAEETEAESVEAEVEVKEVEAEKVETKEADAKETKAESVEAKVEVKEAEAENVEKENSDEDEADFEDIDEEVAESVIFEDEKVVAQENEDAKEIAEIESVKPKSRRGRKKKSEMVEKDDLRVNNVMNNNDLTSLNAQFLADNTKVEEPKKKRGRKPKEKSEAVSENEPVSVKRRGRPPKNPSKQ